MGFGGVAGVDSGQGGREKAVPAGVFPGGYEAGASRLSPGFPRCGSPQSAISHPNELGWGTPVSSKRERDAKSRVGHPPDGRSRLERGFAAWMVSKNRVRVSQDCVALATPSWAIFARALRGRRQGGHLAE